MESPRKFALLAALVFTTAGCGRYGYQALGRDGGPIADAAADAAVDGGTDAGVDAGMDAGVDAGCVLGDWEAPQLLSIGGTSTANFFGGPGPTSDRLALYFSMEPMGGTEGIYVATRANVESSTFGTATAVSELNTAGVEGSPYVSDDLRTIYFFRQPSGGTFNDRDLYSATRAIGDIAQAFSTPAVLANVNSPQIDQGPRTSHDALQLIFSSGRTGSSNEDLYLAERPDTGSNFTVVRRLSELATTGRDQGGSFSADGLTLYYASQRAGGSGGTDLWMASRADTSAASSFGTPTQLPNVNSSSDEFDPVITVDELELFFASGSPARLYHSLRHCLP